MHLIIFDVDGTLTRTTEVDTRCYARAVAIHVAAPIDTDWSGYRHQTDAGILNELLERRGIADPSRLPAVRADFLRLLAAELAADPGCCRPVPGARAVIEHLLALGDVQLAVATGAWADSARLKLRHAGVPAWELPLASSDDAPSREEILRVAMGRASARAAADFESVTCVGDAPWDLLAARSLRLRFVGIGCEDGGSSLRAAGAAVVLPDFTDREAFVRGVLGDTERERE